ncbi:hypothetical protein [Thiospirillum jenense]|uniref:Uncharacterized protein n=1 Tax=Thiospirillum jenense TaxID=1653858 RepID=A0A839H7L8_9GAMM|nr:hypothetical protein [Thiospirillum jenense]MBB1125583.1 hypothetical protein [Thiospirillum jenense]
MPTHIATEFTLAHLLRATALSNPLWSHIGAAAHTTDTALDQALRLSLTQTGMTRHTTLACSTAVITVVY